LFLNGALRAVMIGADLIHARDSSARFGRKLEV